MANIRQLKEDNNQVFYPQTHEKAVIDSNGNTLDTKIAGIQSGLDGAVKTISQTLTEAQKQQARTNIAAASAESVAAEIARATAAEEDIMNAVDGANAETVTVLPAASASTVGKFYYVGPDGNGEYARYRGIESGGSYSFLPVGTTEMDLSTYAKKSEVSQLRSEVTDLELKADLLTKTEQVAGDNIFDKNAVTANSYVNRNNGSITSSSGYNATDWIPVSEDGIYFYKYYHGGAAIGSAVYNANKEYIRGQLGGQYTYQTGDAYVRYTVLDANLDSAMAVIGTDADVPAEYVPYQVTTVASLKENTIGVEQIKTNSIGTEKIKDDAVSFEKIAFKVTEIGKNKLDPSKVTSETYINRDTGAEGPWSLTCATDFIPVSENGLYFNKYYTGGAAIGAAVYDSAKQYLRSCPNPYVYVDGDAFVRYSVETVNLSTAQVEEGTVATEYEAYAERQVINPEYIPRTTPEPEPEESTVEVFLPSQIRAVIGDTLQVFYKGLVKSVDALKYNVCIKCSKGNNYRRYWQYTPLAGESGNYTFQVLVRDDNGNTIATSTSTLVVSSAPSSPVSVKKVVCVGASETANGIWPAEVGRRLVGTGGTPVADGITNVQLCGTKTRDGFGFVGNGGWTWVDYATSGRVAFRFTIGTSPNVAIGNAYTNNGHTYYIVEISDNGTILCETSSASNTPEASGILTKVSGSGDATVPFSASVRDSANPFWDYDNDKLTFIPFANAYCGGTIDYLYILEGINGMLPFKTDFSDFGVYMKDFADTLHTEFPNAKLVLLSYCFPSMELMMPGYGANGGWADTYGMLTAFFNEQKFYQEFANDADYSGFVDYVALAPEVDSDNNFPITMKDVNTRNNTKQEPYANNTIHAGNAGYLQIADAVYRHIVGAFLQS